MSVSVDEKLETALGASGVFTPDQIQLLRNQNIRSVGQFLSVESVPAGNKALTMLLRLTRPRLGEIVKALYKFSGLAPDDVYPTTPARAQGYVPDARPSDFVNTDIKRL